MNDRFKFRAKDIKTGEWRYGFYADLPFGLGSSGVNGEYADIVSCILSYEIKQSSLYSNAEPHEVIIGKTFIVDEESICQCTGMKDRNGKLIYELDYVRYANNKYKVEIDKFLGISLTNILNGDTIVMDDIVLFNCEVIGNEFEEWKYIDENKDLLNA